MATNARIQARTLDLFTGMRAHRSMLALCTLTVLIASGCDGDDQLDQLDQLDQASEAAEQRPQLDIDWDAVALPQVAVGSHEIGAAPAPAVPTSGPNGAQYELETFRYHRSDAFAVTMAPGGLFAPTPAEIEPLTAPNESGLFVGIDIRSEQGDMIGYGSKQHDLDYGALESAGTCTLTIPGRGTLMLAHREDMSVIMGEVNDMLANNESIRSYDTPVVYQSTMPDTGLVIGGTGEFANAMGEWREIVALQEFNLLSLEHTFEVFVQVALLPNGGQGG